MSPRAKKAPPKLGRCYISGPMSGVEYANFPAFFDAQQLLESMGYEVVNPAQKTSEGDPDPHPTPEKWLDWIIEDLADVATCSHICLLTGWYDSSGSQIERLVAQKFGLTELRAFKIKGKITIEEPPELD